MISETADLSLAARCLNATLGLAEIFVDPWKWLRATYSRSVLARVQGDWWRMPRPAINPQVLGLEHGSYLWYASTVWLPAEVYGIMKTWPIGFYPIKWLTNEARLDFSFPWYRDKLFFRTTYEKDFYTVNCQDITGLSVLIFDVEALCFLHTEVTCVMTYVNRTLYSPHKSLVVYNCYTALYDTFYLAEYKNL